MSGGVSGGRIRSANGGSGQPNGATTAPNGGASTTGVIRAASGITKPEADVWYVNVEGDAMTGPLTVEGRAVALDPAADNALTWTGTGLYAPPAPEVPEAYLTEGEADLRYLQLTGGALSGALSIAGKNVGVSTGDQNRLVWDATGFYVPPEFVDHSASHDWYFSTNTTITTDPGQGNLRSNTGNLQTATDLALDLLTNNGMDMSAVVGTLQSGDVMLVQDKDVGGNWVRYALAAAPSLQSGYWRLTVTRQAGAGVLSTAQLVAVVFWVENLPAPVDVAITGDNGVAVVESPTNTFALTTRVSPSAGNQLTLQSGGLYAAGGLSPHDHTAADGSGVLTNEQHDGYSQYANLGADPAQPGTNTIRLYSKDNGSGIATLYYRTEDGTVYELPTLTSGGGGSGAPANATYITTAAESKLSAERVLGTAVVMTGTLSGRPAAGTAGRLYLASDNDLAYRDNGSAWDVFATRHGQTHNLFSTDHPDVDAADVPADGQVLTYSSAAGKWVAAPGGGGGGSGLPTTGGTMTGTIASQGAAADAGGALAVTSPNTAAAELKVYGASTPAITAGSSVAGSTEYGCRFTPTNAQYLVAVRWYRFSSGLAAPTAVRLWDSTSTATPVWSLTSTPPAWSDSATGWKEYRLPGGSQPLLVAGRTYAVSYTASSATQTRINSYTPVPDAGMTFVAHASGTSGTYPTTTGANAFGVDAVVRSTASANTPAASGAIRLPNDVNGAVAWRNGADGGDLSLRMDAADRLAVVVGSGALTTSAAGGSATAPPSQPVEYLTVVVNGNARKVALYS